MGEWSLSAFARERWPSLTTGVALAGLVAWAFWSRWQFLDSAPVPLGIDGYFYPVQLRSLLADGHLYYPSGPLSLWWMAPFAAVTDPIVGAKLGTALGASLLPIPMFFLGRRISGDRAIGLLVAVLVATSASSFYLTTEFAKNCLGLTVAASYLCALAWCLDAPSRRRAAAALVALLAVALTHKQAAAFALVATVPVLIAFARERAVDARARSQLRRRATIVAASVLGLAVIAAVAAPARFLAARDLHMLTTAFSSTPEWGLPALRTGPSSTLSFGYEVVIAGALGLVALVVLIMSRRLPSLGLVSGSTRARDRALVIGPALVALVVALPWLDVADPDGIGFRLRVTAFMPLALCAALVVSTATLRLQTAVRTALVVGFAMGWLVSRPMSATERGVVRVHPAMVTAVRAMDGVVPEGDVVIVPERQVMFMVTWYTGRPARLAPGRVPADRRWRLVTYHYGGPALRRAMDVARRDAPPTLPPLLGLHPYGRNGLVLMPERTWRWVLDQLTPRDRVRYDAWR